MTKERQALDFLRTASSVHQQMWTTVEKILYHNRNKLSFRIQDYTTKVFRAIVLLDDKDAITLQRPFKTREEAEKYGEDYLKHIKSLSSRYGEESS